MSMAPPNIPGYRVDRLLGTGGMAAVYLATQLNLKRPVAMKVMANTLSLDETFRQRFLNEAEIVAQFSHPNIMRIYDSGTVDGTLYMVTEYMDGGTLKERAAHGIASDEAIDIIARLAEALELAHEQRIYHRDIKPDNVLFDRRGRFVLADFGIAKMEGAEGKSLTGTGNIIGTPHYMSPEQFQGQPIDGRSDIYSLGIMLYQMLVGAYPYDAPDMIALAMKHVQTPIPRLQGVLAVFQPLIERMLAKDPAMRFQSCTELRAYIRKLGTELPTEELRRFSHTPAAAAVGAPADAGTGSVSGASGFSEAIPATDVRARDPIEACGPTKAARASEVAIAQPSTSSRMALVAAITAVLGLAAWAGVHTFAPRRTIASSSVASQTTPPSADPNATSEPNSAAPNASPGPAAASPVQPSSALTAPIPNPTTGGATDQRIRAVVGAPRAHGAVDAAALQALSDADLEARLGEQLRNARRADWESMLAALSASAPKRYPVARHLGLFSRLQKAGVDIDAAMPISSDQKAAAATIAALLADARRYAQGGKNGRPEPPAANAVDCYRMVLALDPANAAARQGLEALSADFVSAADVARSKGNLAAALKIYDRALAMDPENQQLQSLKHAAAPGS